VTMAGVTIWTGEFDEGERWLMRTRQALRSDTGPGITLLLRHTTGILSAARGRHRDALAEFTAAERLQSQLVGSHALENQLVGWKIAAQARVGLVAEARAALDALDPDRAGSGEIGNARAAVGLAVNSPAEALGHVLPVIDGSAPVIGYVTVVEALLLAALAHRDLGDRRAASDAAEHALALAEADRLVLPFAMTGSHELLKTLARHETAHAALLAGILDVLQGASLPPWDGSSAAPAEQLSPTELKVLRFLPTNLSRPEIASELSVSVNTVNTHIRNIYAKLGAQDRSSAVQRARELRLLSGGLAR
jgi:LuxR family transcriptional regulator, maltose regulon positive regulatory protein